MSTGRPPNGTWLVSRDDKTLAQVLGVDDDGKIVLEDAASSAESPTLIKVTAAELAARWKKMEARAAA